MNIKQILLVLTSIVVFILFWISTDDAFNTNSLFKTLSQSEDTYVFKTADITLYSCKTAYVRNDCEKVHSIRKVKLADLSDSALISDEVLERSTHAVFEYIISETIRKVYNKLDSISYVSVNTAHLQSVIRTNISRKHYHRGFGANLDQIFFKSTLDKSDFFVHEVYFGDLDAFGPQTFPPILTSPQNLRKISQLIPSLAFF